jgi:hypothetical protein
MRVNLLIYIFVLFFCSCQPIENRKTIDLGNGLGELSFTIPNDMDISHSWLYYSDHSCGRKNMFRFANKNYSLLETKFFIIGKNLILYIN